jgi:arabinose-5-phosphate isomerase
VALILPKAAEACETGVVPTTSTTLTMALGDALAVALMKHRRFTPDQFRTFHPGGSLGSQLRSVADLMHADFPSIPPETAMSEALLAMTRSGFGTVGVVGKSGKLDGIITDGDLRRHMDGLLGMTAADVMSRGPRTVQPDALAESAVHIMHENKITALFVVEKGKPVGFINIHDCLRAGIV